MPSRRPPKKHPPPAARLSATEEFELLFRRAPETTRYVLRLFVTGTTPRSIAAISNIRDLCEKHLAGHVDLEVVDIYQQPRAAQSEQIIAAPTLVREFPTPPKRMVGDLSDPQKVLLGLNLVHRNTASDSAGNSHSIDL